MALVTIYDAANQGLDVQAGSITPDFNTQASLVNIVYLGNSEYYDLYLKENSQFIVKNLSWYFRIYRTSFVTIHSKKG